MGDAQNEGLVIVTKGNDYVVINTLPDMCKVPGVPAPQAFPNTIDSAKLLKGATSRTLIANQPVWTKNGEVGPLSGPLAPYRLGARGQMYCGEAIPLSYARGLFFEGFEPVRAFDLAHMDHRNTLGLILPKPLVAQLLGIGPGGGGSIEEQRLWEALRRLNDDALYFATRFIPDARVRAMYLQSIAAMSRQIQDGVLRETDPALRQMMAQVGAEDANLLRNQMLAGARGELTDFGRALSVYLKEEGLSLAQANAKYSQELFGAAYNQLDDAQRYAVNMKVIERSGVGRSFPLPGGIRIGPRGIQNLGRGLFLLTAAISTYNVVTAEDMGDAAMREGAQVAGGVGGSLAMAWLGAKGGALVGAPLGPWGIGICGFIGGVGGAFGASWLIDWLVPPKKPPLEVHR